MRGRRGIIEAAATITALLSATATMSDLSYHEQDVFALLGQRKTDGEIAAHLFFSRKTTSNGEPDKAQPEPGSGSAVAGGAHSAPRSARISRAARAPARAAPSMKP